MTAFFPAYRTSAAVVCDYLWSAHSCLVHARFAVRIRAQSTFRTRKGRIANRTAFRRAVAERRAYSLSALGFCLRAALLMRAKGWMR